MVSLNSGVLVDAGIDYLSVTAKSRERREKLENICVGLAESEFYSGGFARPVSFSGYEGLQVGHVYFGVREDSALARVSSTVAQAHWQRLIETADNVTRIDLQATFDMGQDPQAGIKRHYSQLRRHAKQFKRFPRPSLFVGQDESVTVYTGSRSSDRYGRIYDKGRESKSEQFKNCVRYEQEIKGKRALRVAFGISEGHVCNLCLARTACRFFSERGCLLPALASSSSCYEVFTSSLHKVTSSDAVRVLEWLGQAVRPSVSRLIAGGFREQLGNALGISIDSSMGQMPRMVAQANQNTGGHAHDIQSHD